MASLKFLRMQQGINEVTEQKDNGDSGDQVIHHGSLYRRSLAFVKAHNPMNIKIPINR